MSDKAFIDSNIIVYAYDKHEPEKQTKAQNLLSRSIQEESAVLSTQVLGEFFVVVTRKIKNPLSIEEAERIIDIMSILPVAEIDLPLVKQAIVTQKRYGLSYWDSLIISTAECTGCNKVFSEDLGDGQKYHDVIVENPFSLSAID